MALASTTADILAAAMRIDKDIHHTQERKSLTVFSLKNPANLLPL